MSKEKELSPSTVAASPVDAEPSADATEDAKPVTASEEIIEGVVPEQPSAVVSEESALTASEQKDKDFSEEGAEQTSYASLQQETPPPSTSETSAEEGIQAESIAEDSAVNSFADLPKKKRTPPPRKTREERGLPPLPEDGEEPNASAQSEEPKGMTLMEHLSELRTRLVRSFIAVGLAFIVCYTFAEQLFAELCKPLIAALPAGSKLIFTALPEAFFVYVQVGLLAAVFVASPFLFYQIWSFVSPGLYEEEKKYMIPMAVISAGFFIAGASFCFFMVFPYAFTFFVGFASEDIAAMPSLSEYLSFAMKLLIAFGLIFEMPLFTFFLARMRVVTADSMRKFRKYAVLCSFVIAAILTPPDVISQLLMAFPMMLLYEMSIGVAVIFGRKKQKENEESDEATEQNEAAAKE